MKTDVEYLRFMWPMRHFLITCGNIKKQANIIAISFCMPVSKQPPLIACAISKNAYSYQLIKESGELIVNIPPGSLKSKVYYCGFNSGRDVDKFIETGLTPLPAKQLKVPAISECVAHLECRVQQEVATGDKVLFISEVIESYADETIDYQQESITDYAQGKFPKKIYSTRFSTSE